MRVSIINSYRQRVQLDINESVIDVHNDEGLIGRVHALPDSDEPTVAVYGYSPDRAIVSRCMVIAQDSHDSSMEIQEWLLYIADWLAETTAYDNTTHVRVDGMDVIAYDMYAATGDNDNDIVCVYHANTMRIGMVIRDPLTTNLIVSAVWFPDLKPVASTIRARLDNGSDDDLIAWHHSAISFIIAQHDRRDIE